MLIINMEKNNMIKYIIRNADDNALRDNKKFDTLEAARLYAEGDKCWIDEVKVRKDGCFKSTRKVGYAMNGVTIDRSINSVR